VAAARRKTCYVSFRTAPEGRWQYNTEAGSVFEAAMNAIRWFNEWKGPRPRRSTVLTVDMTDMGKKNVFHVRAERVVKHFGLDPGQWLDE
jgi:hypothetical protein